MKTEKAKPQRVFVAVEKEGRFIHNGMDFSPKDLRKFMELKEGSWTIFLAQDSKNKNFCGGRYITLTV